MGASTSGSTKQVTDYERVDAGVYPARCIQVVELGTHDNTYQGETKKRKELMIVWEISGELMQDGRPFVVSWRGTNTLNEKGQLYKMLISWRGAPFTDSQLQKFELKNILDACCMINISKETSKAGKIFNKVITVMPLPKGMKCDERQNPLVDFGITDINNDEFTKLWPWVQRIVLESDEGKRFNGSVDNNDDEDDLPFS
jgi:hypothetical protein